MLRFCFFIEIALIIGDSFMNFDVFSVFIYYDFQGRFSSWWDLFFSGFMLL